MRKGLSLVLAVMAGAAVLAAACAPAAESNKQQSGSQQPATKGDIQQVQPIQQQLETKSETAKQGGQQATGAVKTSVSGIPLDPAAKNGGILRSGGVTGEGPTFSTWEEAAGVAFNAMHPLHNMLIQTQSWGSMDDYKANAFFKVHPDLAKTWESSADGLTWTFKLRDGVKWSDGKAVTCADVKWSYDRIRTGEGLKRSPRGIHWNVIKDITCPDDLTVVITLKRAKPGFLEVIAQPYNLIRPKHVYENNTDPMRNEPARVTTGPFILKEWIPGEKYVFSRNPNYWDQPFPYLDGIELPILTNQAVDSALLAGRIDIPSPSGYAGPRAERILKECQLCQYWPRTVWSSLSPAVMVHHQRPPWNSPELKDAIGYALDRKKYVKVVQLDWYLIPTAGPFFPGGAWDFPDDRLKQIPGYNFDDPEGNKQKAREILAKAGYKPNDLKVTVDFWAPIQQDIPAIIEDLRAVGIDAESRVLEQAAAYATWSAGDFTIGVHSFWVAGLDADVVLYEQFYTGSDRNYNRYSNPKYDALVDEMSATLDPELRKKKAWDAAEIAMKDQAKHIMSYGTSMPTANKRVKGWLPALNYLAAYGPMLRFQSVWIDETAK